MPSRGELFDKAKNQVYTPAHIVELMDALCGTREDSHVLDPTCGDGAILSHTKAKHIYGIEFDDASAERAKTTGAAIVCDSVFNTADQIRAWNIDTVLMNPPFNAPADSAPAGIREDWTKTAKEDPTKGLCFVRWTADVVGQGRLAAILPIRCLGDSKQITAQKRQILKHHTLDAVFTLPTDLFEAGVSTALLVFTLGQPHDKNKEVMLLNLADDGYEKHKTGRQEKSPGTWEAIKQEYVSLFETHDIVEDKSLSVSLTAEDSWSFISHKHFDTTPTAWDFYKTVSDYLDFKMSQERKRREAELKAKLSQLTLDEYMLQRERRRTDAKKEKDSSDTG